MKTIFALLGFVFACLFAHAQGEPYDEQIAAFCNNAATGGAAAPWVPTYALQYNLTNSTRVQYTDSGLYVQAGWQAKLLVNIRSNPAVQGRMGVFMSGTSASYAFGHSQSPIVTAFYGPNSSLDANTPAIGWHFISIVTTGQTDMVFYTNGVKATSVNGTSFTATNTTAKFFVGCMNNNGTPAAGPSWDIARVQLIDNMGTLALDLMATSNGTWTNKLTGATFTAGLLGTGMTSANVSNIVGQVPAAVTNCFDWK